MTLIDHLLAEQQRLQTPVARFAESFDRGQPVPASLIPLSAPGPGEQYAFEVELDACTGCKSCVTACHSLNGLDEDESWRDVGLLVSPDPELPFVQPVTTACHHCADPACLNGCPVLAYEKDPATGIVRHLDDQCIGCSYCVLMCPYDVPKYNPARGIVRKCDMCHGRLAHGEAPACAQACPTQAIRIVTVTTGRGLAGEGPQEFLPAAPDPGITGPTTRYRSQRGLPPGLVAADAGIARPQPAHWPLVVMLTLLPMSLGGFAIVAVQENAGNRPAPPLLAMAGLAGAIGLVSSGFHLGKPLRAWRIFLGWRKSWLSREAMAFGAWLPLAGASLAAGFSGRAVGPLLANTTVAVGFVALACSAMIYAETRREFWRLGQSATRFFGSAAVLGLAAAFAAGVRPRFIGISLALAVLAKLAFETRALRLGSGTSPSGDTARLLRGPLRPILRLRALAGLGGGVLVPAVVLFASAPAWAAYAGLALALAGELAERLLFFRAVVASKMPGVIPS